MTVLRIELWLPDQSTIIIQGPIPHLLVTYEVQNQEFMNRAVWTANCSEHTALLSLSAGWFALTLRWKVTLSETAIHSSV